MGYCFVKRCAGGGSGGGSNIELLETSVTITENTTTTLEAAEGKAYKKVEIKTAIKQNYCLVRFYNDDRTTLLYEVLVPYGSSAVYAGDAPVSSLGADYTFTGFEPSTESVTADTDCYAVYDEPVVPDTPEGATLEATSWAAISALSAAGTAANYFAVGDTKAVTLNGNVGAGLTLNNETYYVYILGFDHNSALEGNGITFGTFKTAASGGKDICLVDSSYRTKKTDGTKLFNIFHAVEANSGGWAGSDVRYDILGSTDTQAANPSTACATTPVANTLMAALPTDLRAVMKPMTIYSDNTGGGTENTANVTATIDYLPLLAEYEIFGSIAQANAAEKNYQQQYAYYAAGNSKVKYSHSSIDTAALWWERSVRSYTASQGSNVSAGGTTDYYSVGLSLGIAPIFRV